MAIPGLSRMPIYINRQATIPIRIVDVSAVGKPHILHRDVQKVVKYPSLRARRGCCLPSDAILVPSPRLLPYPIFTLRCFSRINVRKEIKRQKQLHIDYIQIEDFFNAKLLIIFHIGTHLYR